MGAKTRVGLVFAGTAYVLYFVLVPPLWAPWSSPLSLFGFLYAFLALVGVAILGASLVSYDAIEARATGIRDLPIAVAGPTAAVLPIYLYATVIGGTGPTAPIHQAAFATAVVAGCITFGAAVLADPD